MADYVDVERRRKKETAQYKTFGIRIPNVKKERSGAIQDIWDSHPKCKEDL